MEQLMINEVEVMITINYRKIIPTIFNENNKNKKEDEKKEKYIFHIIK